MEVSCFFASKQSKTHALRVIKDNNVSVKCRGE